MKFFLDLTPTTRITLNQWGKDGSVSVHHEHRPVVGGCWVPSDGCVLEKRDALSLGCAILNLCGSRDALIKKHRWDD